MFGREFNDFDDFRNIASAMEVTEAMEKRMEFWKEFKEAVLPALVDSNTAVQSERREGLDQRKQMQPLKANARVMVRD